MEHIFHITSQSAWDEALTRGEYRAASLASEGFIHASTSQQLEASANRFFAGHSSILLLKIVRTRVIVPICWERSPHSEMPFPHLYGPLNLDAVIDIIPLHNESGKGFVIPPGMVS